MHLTLSIVFALTAVALGCMPDAVLNTTSSHVLPKRYFTNDKKANNLKWENNEIVFCWRDKKSQDELELLIPAGWNLWRAAGVDSRLKFRQGSDSDCKEAKMTTGNPKDYLSKNRDSILMIGYQKNRFLTSVGRSSSKDDDFEAGPQMWLDSDPSLALGNAAANVAHEIGHAWGFFHEHQRPDLWKSPLYDWGTGKRNHFIFTCENLNDFDAWYERRVNHVDVPGQQPLGLDVDRACRNYVRASVENLFSASNILPMPAPGADHLGGPEGTDPNVDWESIMLYPSRLGGKVLEDGTQAKVLVMANGDEILPNLVPSPWDVARLNEMYPQDGPDPAPCFYFQDCYPKAGFFLQRALKKAQGSCPAGGT